MCPCPKMDKRSSRWGNWRSSFGGFGVEGRERKMGEEGDLWMYTKGEAELEKTHVSWQYSRPYDGGQMDGMCRCPGPNQPKLRTFQSANKPRNARVAIEPPEEIFHGMYSVHTPSGEFASPAQTSGGFFSSLSCARQLSPILLPRISIRSIPSTLTLCAKPFTTHNAILGTV